MFFQSWQVSKYLKGETIVINLSKFLSLTILLVFSHSTALAQQDYTLEQARSAFGECKAAMDGLVKAGKRSDPQWRSYTQCVRICGSLASALEQGQSPGRGQHCPHLYSEATGESLPGIAAAPPSTPSEESAAAPTQTYQVDAELVAEFTARKNDCAKYVGSEHESVAKDALACVSECRVPIFARPGSVNLHKNRCVGKHGTFMRNYVPRISPPSAEHFTGLTATLEYLDSWASLQNREGGHAWQVVSSSDPLFAVQCPIIGYHIELGGGGNVQGEQAQTVSQWNLKRVTPTSDNQAIGTLGARCFVIDMEPIGATN